ncbi:MAG: hypothetical protein ACI9UD_000174 [Glaciecola sp.]|jgi:hypothetical protein
MLLSTRIISGFFNSKANNIATKTATNFIAKESFSNASNWFCNVTYSLSNGFSRFFLQRPPPKKNKKYISNKVSQLRNRQTYLGSISFTWRCTDNSDPVIPKLTDTKSININVLKSIDVKLKLT